MFRRLFYLFFGLSVVFAVAFSLADDPEQERLLSNFFAISLGLTLSLLAQDGITQGHIRGARRKVSRDEQPILFWSIVALYFLVAGILVGAGFWRLAFQ